MKYYENFVPVFGLAALTSLLVFTNETDGLEFWKRTEPLITICKVVLEDWLIYLP